MATEWICDGCGRREPGVPGTNTKWQKPRSWYERSDKGGIQTACSRTCIGIIENRENFCQITDPDLIRMLY